jgi:S-DNA-T family DNA segregation ATPase FtsK/SpoIIIE
VDRKKHEIFAICVLVATLLIFLSLISFRQSDLTIFNSSTVAHPPGNLVGTLGAHLAWPLLFVFGLGAYWLPLTGFLLSFSYFRGISPFPRRASQLIGLGLLLLSSVSLASIHQMKIHFLGQEIMTGGVLGKMLGGFLVAELYSVGAHILLIGVLLVALVLATPFSLGASTNLMSRLLVSLGKWFLGLVSRFRERARSGPEPPEEKVAVVQRVPRESAPPVEVLPALTAPPRKRAKPQATALIEQPTEPGQYALPALDLLDAYETEIREPDWKKLEADSHVLEEKLADFGVQGKVVGISPGPVITMYEYAPAPGIKISRIVGLSDDLAMALKAISIRVVAPIPGKAAIGIEVPNQKRDLVAIHTVVESEAFLSASASLIIALGQDITGQSVVANLGKMPHMLIAGATGTGKSVCINAVLSSLLFRNTPNDIRLLLIDPKRIELNSYEGIPHLIHPVVTDAKMATRALRWAVQEMELRYRLLADKGVRNIESYNKAVAKDKRKEQKQKEDPREEAGLQHHILPYIVIVIDELADLMMVASREVEESITRLAQMARAAGIHLILATQRPSVDVLTGIIKANIPTRISFQVSSRIDSRTILDTSGAESLLGSGDMLFLPPGTAKIQRIHGAFISDGEVQRLTSFWQSQQLIEDPLKERVNFQEDASSEEISEDDLDEKYEEAVDLVIETRQASISMLQRRLRVGYNRAARMIEMMEQQGIVGESDGVKAREVHGRK